MNKFIVIVCFIVGCIVAFLIGNNIANIGLEANWITAFSNVITAIATIILAYSVYTAIENNRIQKEHNDKQDKIKKQEKTLEVLQHWHQNLDAKNSFARSFAEKLSIDNLRKLSEKSNFAIKAEMVKQPEIDHLNKLFEFEIKKNNDDYEIDVSSSIELRWQLIMYLNKLEAVCFAWSSGLINREIIEKEFKYMFEKENTALKNFRDLNKNSFPCIDKFEQDMNKKFGIKIEKNDEI